MGCILCCNLHYVHRPGVLPLPGREYSGVLRHIFNAFLLIAFLAASEALHMLAKCGLQESFLLGLQDTPENNPFAQSHTSVCLDFTMLEPSGC